MADLYNLIEQGAPWPDATKHARAAYLAKDPERADDPLAYRVLMILSTFYRKYMTLRNRDMQSWMDDWILPEMFAVGSNGAEDAWDELSADIEDWDVNNIEYAGGTVDIAKCFDQIIRELVYSLAAIGGMPPQVLDAYRRFQ